VYNEVYDSADEDIETWEGLNDKMNDGETVYAPAPEKSNKRKRVRNSPKKRKKRQRADDFDDDDDEFIDDEEDSGSSNSSSDTESDSDEVQAPRVPLTEEDIEQKLEELKETKKNARRQRADLNARIRDVRPKIQEAKAKIAELRGEMNAICIAGRNEYSKGAVQRDFAAGIRELDQEAAAEEDEENFNPTEDIPDYDEVARSLPVFCVSSRAYQKMCGRLKKDDAVPGFHRKEETWIPQLQAHCKKLTEAGRVQNCRSFLNSLCSQLTTFSFWASDDGSGLKLTDNEKENQVKYLNFRLSELEKGLDKAVETCIKTMKKDMEDQIVDKYPDIIAEAAEAAQAAPHTVNGWGAHRSQGGMYWATYKATVRREGAFTGAAGPRDFDAELVDPISKKFATSWERTFQNCLPNAFEVYTMNSSAMLKTFHEKVEERARGNGVSLASIGALKPQIYNYEQLFADLKEVLVQSMTELQRDANRGFTPTVKAAMLAVQDACDQEVGMLSPLFSPPKMSIPFVQAFDSKPSSGKGQFLRMKSLMANFVDQARHTMFSNATQTVRDHLGKMCKELQQLMENKADDIFTGMRRDYLRVLGGVQINQTNEMSKEERMMRAEVKPLLMSVDEEFRKILEGDWERRSEGRGTRRRRGGSRRRRHG
jgi:hypothetical protein